MKQPSAVWGWAALAIVAAGTVGLVALVMRSPAGSSALGTPIPIDAFAPAQASTPDPTTSADAPEPLQLPVQSRLIAGADAQHAYRTSSVTCPAEGDAIIQATTDGGATWTDHPAPGAAAFLSLAPYKDPKTIAGTVALPDCTIDFWRSFTSGAAWTSKPTARADAVVLDPEDPATILRDAGKVASPCAGIAAGALYSGGMAVVCSDAVLYTSPPDHPEAWAAPVLPGSAVAVAAADEGYVVALRRDADCPGLALVALSAEGAVQPVGCLDALADESSPVTLGTALDGSLWLWAGDRVGVSADGGRTWMGLS